MDQREYHSHENKEQVKNLIERIRDKGINPLNGEFSVTFYRNVDSEDLLRDLSKRYAYSKHTKDLVRYFERYVEIFFNKPYIFQ